MFKSSKSKKKSATTTEPVVETTVVEGDGFTMVEPAIESTEPVEAKPVEIASVEAKPVVEEPPVEAPKVEATEVEVPAELPKEVPTLKSEDKAEPALSLLRPRTRAELVEIRRNKSAANKAAEAAKVEQIIVAVEQPVATTLAAPAEGPTSDGPWVALKMTEGAWKRVQRREMLNSGQIKK